MEMFEKFEALNEEKKKSIINAAMTEFLKGGYEKASMNHLVEAAGISKGSLFYYFKNKKTLYLYLFEYCETMILKNAEKSLGHLDPDFLSRMNQNMRGNVILLREFPLVYAFMKSCKAEKSDLVSADIHEIKVKRTDELFGRLYKDIDKSLFRTDIDIEMAMYSIKATMFQRVHDYLNQGDLESDVVFEKLEACTEFFRTVLYK